MYIAGLIPQSPASDAGNVRRPRVRSGSQVRIDQCFDSESGGGTSICLLR